MTTQYEWNQRGQALVEKWFSRLGYGFHPDTRGADYYNEAGERSLSAQEALEYEADMDYAFELIGYKVYLHVLDCGRKQRQSALSQFV